MSELKAFAVRLDQAAKPPRVEIVGSMSDDVSQQLDGLANELRALSGEVVFDFSRLEFVNSHAIGIWKRFVDRLKVPFSFERCTSYLVEYLNVFPEIMGKGSVASFFVPYACTSCGKAVEILMTTKAVDLAVGLPTSKPCPKCGVAMRLEVDPLDFVSFLGS